MKKTKKQGKRKKVRISENLHRNKVKKLTKKAGKKEREIAEKEERKNSRNVKMEKLQKRK